DSNAGGVVAGSVHQLMQSDQVILVSAGCLDSNAGGVVAGSVHQLMQSDQVILVSAGCLQLFTTITATAPDRDRGRVFEAEPGLRDRLAALQAY
ncbi:hypothetical protein ABBQ38_009672, partial [Trebouxia sp. C0009 RCD-2024]